MDEKTEKLAATRKNILSVPTNKRDVSRISAGIIVSILEGKEEALSVDIKLRYLEEMVKQIRGNEKIKEAILNEAELHPGKSFEAHGCEITKKELGVRFDFSNSNDSTHTDLLNQIADLKATLKKRETMLKSINGEMADPETGEILYPPVRKSTSGISVKLA